MQIVEMLAKLGLALLLGALVGLERERRDRPAGLRTHILVCLGSALMTLVSVHLSPSADPTRIAAQIVSGIGFLGAGTIFRSGSAVRGLTTAAGLWVVAGIGMGVAAGGVLLLLACATAAAVFGVNQWGRVLEARITVTHQDLTLRLTRGQDALARTLETLSERGVTVDELEWRSRPTDEDAEVRVRLRLPQGLSENALLAWVSELPGVRSVEWG